MRRRADPTERALDVARLVDDPDPEVRLALIHTASDLHAGPEALVRYMSTDLDPAVRTSAETWLERRERDSNTIAGAR